MNAVGPRVRTDERRAFNRFKHEFYDRMIRSKELTVLDLRISWLLLSTFLNWETGTAWPAARTIAEILCVREESVRRSIRRLTTLGWWRIVEQGRRGRSNEYAPNWDRPQQRRDLTTQDPDRPVRVGQEDAADTLTDRSDDRTSGSEDPDRWVTPTLLGNPENEPKEATVHSNRTAEPRTADGTKMIARREDDSDATAVVDREPLDGSGKGEPVGPATKRRQQNSNKGVNTHKALSSVPRETSSKAAAAELWNASLEGIGRAIADQESWQTWSSQIEPLSVQGDCLVLSVPSSLMAEIVRRDFGEAITQVTGLEVEVHVVPKSSQSETNLFPKQSVGSRDNAAAKHDTAAQPAGPRKSGTHD